MQNLKEGLHNAGRKVSRWYKFFKYTSLVILVIAGTATYMNRGYNFWDRSEMAAISAANIYGVSQNVQIEDAKMIKLLNSSPNNHVVKKDETLYSIAEKYKTTVSRLIKLNDKKNDIIKPYEVIIIH